MEDQDKIFDQFKEAALKSEKKEFGATENTWARIEDRLDKKLLEKRSNNWKKVAVAASVLLCVSVGYQFLKKAGAVADKDKIVNSDKHQPQVPKATENTSPVIQTVEAKTSNHVIRKDSDKILEQQLLRKEVVSVTPSAEADHLPSPLKQTQRVNDSTYFMPHKADYPEMEKKGNAVSWRSNIYPARTVKEENQVQLSEAETISAQDRPGNPPLYVYDGKAVNEKKLSGISKEEIDSVLVLREPLYIINGAKYSEEDLFGINPTCPYAPLSEQEITAVRILDETEAISTYGEKGKKGVVIITTKTIKTAKSAKQK